MRWRKVTLVGVGLLGGSLGLALRTRRLAGQVSGYVRRSPAIDEAVQAGAVDDASTDLLGAVAGADLVVLSTPLSQMGSLARNFASALAPGTIVTDVGSVKKELVDDLDPVFEKAGAHFIGSHPMAGSEKMGVSAARADLFERACCIVTPTARTNEQALARVEELWISVGARPLRMDADLHDQLVARSSHLPHLLAANLASYVLSPEFPREQGQLCAGGFKDSTRIASGSPEMWRDIVLMNRAHVSQAIDDFRAQLDQFQAALDRNDAAAIDAFYTEAKARRDRWTAQCAARNPE